MERTIDMVGGIAHASAEQRNAMELLSQEVERVATLAEQNLSVFNGSSELATDLHSVEEPLRNAVQQHYF
jgi:methyl-accepting chemotaxis protein